MNFTVFETDEPPPAPDRSSNYRTDLWHPDHGPNYRTLLERTLMLEDQ